MALKECSECGKGVSTKAKKCPNCGAPVKSSKPGGCLTVIAIIFVIVIVHSFFNTNSDKKTPPLRTQKETSTSQVQSDSSVNATKLVQKILKRHSGLDSFFYEPHLYGELSDKPLLTLALPTEDWKSLSRNEKSLLCKYLATLIPNVKSTPFKYSKLSSTAPIAPLIRSKVATMTNDSCGFLIGDITTDGHDIQLDKVICCGK